MTWVVWTAVAAFIVVLLAVSWWYDRDARKRGATPASSGAMSRARRANERDIAREMSQVDNKSMTPKSEDALRDAWRGRTEQR